MTTRELSKTAYNLRIDILDLIHTAKAGHIGGDMSVIDILTILYYKHMNVSPETLDDPDRDRLVLSKGHTVEALYAVLAGRGFIPREALQQVGKYGTPYIGHPSNKISGIETCSGSLGHGLPVSVGMALAGRMDGRPYRVYTVMGDGELAEGSVWEGAMAAGHFGLDNLTAFVDRNRLQISGGTEDVMKQDDQTQRWQGFGWNVLEADGNDMNALDNAIEAAKEHKGNPTVILCNTVKGCGVSYMENQAGWHHKVPTEEQYQQGRRELEQRRDAV